METKSIHFFIKVSTISAFSKIIFVESLVISYQLRWFFLFLFESQHIDSYIIEQ